MSQLLEHILGQLSDSHFESIGKQIGADASQTKIAVSSALPLLLNAMSYHANSTTSLSLLSSMLDSNHNGSVIDDIFGVVTGSQPATTAASTPDGDSALKTILGSQVAAAQDHVAQNSGLAPSVVAKLLPLLGAAGAWGTCSW